MATATEDTKVPLDLTNPDNVRTSLSAILGPMVAEMVGDALRSSIGAMGLDKVDRKYLRFPESDRVSFAEDDLTDPHGWDIEPIRAKRRILLKAWFRHALFGTGFDKSLPGCDVSESMIRAMSTTDSEGGVLIPPGFIAEVTRDVEKLSQLFRYVRRMPVPGLSGTMPKVTTNVEVYWGAENEDIDEDQPGFDETEYTVRRLNAITKLSREIASDSNPEIVSVVVSLFNEALAAERDKVIAIGSGTGRPLGLYSATGITNVSVTTLTYSGLVDLMESVDQRYHDMPSFRWHMNQNVKAGIMKILDENNLPIFRPAIGNEPATILGKPFSIEKSFPNNYLGIGALSYYIWFDRGQAGVESTNTGGDSFRKHQTWIKFFERADGKPVLPPTVPMARTRVLTGVTSLT